MPFLHLFQELDSGSQGGLSSSGEADSADAMSVTTPNGGVSGLQNGLPDVPVNGSVTTSTSEATNGTCNNSHSGTSDKVCYVSFNFLLENLLMCVVDAYCE